MSSLKSSASYKKQDGTIAISLDKHYVSWTPSTGGQVVKVAVANITNLQKSPETSPKVSVRIVVQPAGAPTPENHVFTFSSPSARSEQTAIVDALSGIIKALKAGQGGGASTTGTTVGAGGGAGQPAALAIAAVVSAGGNMALDEDKYSDERLITDLNLQRSLLNSHADLRQRFDESFRGKPDTISVSQFSLQFWSTRLHLLRAHAVEKNQQHGVYNVLPEIKLKRDTATGNVRLNITKEQIQLIFNQHPLVKRVYDDLVPNKFSEGAFWSKFFVSKLVKKLKGEKITDLDSNIPELDKYLHYDEEAERTRQFIVAHVPRFIDIEGNEQNHSQRKGNAPDISMRPQSHEKVPVLKAINALSEKMMVNVAPSEGGLAHAPAGLDEDTFNQLQLRDLQRQADDNRVMLNIREQQRVFGRDKTDSTRRHDIDRGKVVKSLRRETALRTPLASVLTEDPTQATTASTSILKSIKGRAGHQTAAEADAGLSQTTLDAATMTHNTTIEFLHYFWTVFLSGDDTRAGELQKLVETLGKSLARVDAVAQGAEVERQAKVEERKKQVEVYFQRTGKKRPVGKVGGGKKAVEELLAGTVRAVRFAEEEYKRVLTEQSALLRD